MGQRNNHSQVPYDSVSRHLVRPLAYLHSPGAYWPNDFTHLRLWRHGYALLHVWRLRGRGRGRSDAISSQIGIQAAHGPEEDGGLFIALSPDM